MALQTALQDYIIHGDAHGGDWGDRPSDPVQAHESIVGRRSLRNVEIVVAGPRIRVAYVSFVCAQGLCTDDVYLSQWSA